MVSLLLLVLLLAIAVDGAVPVCRHVTTMVATSDDIVITLLPYDTQGLTILKTTIETLPGSGSLYQLSQVYADFGYEPKADTLIATPITDVYSLAVNRILFRPPLGFTRTRFTYSATNINGKSTIFGNVDITIDGVAVSSDFILNDEGWIVSYDSTSSPIWSSTSIGSLNRYIAVSSIPFVVNSANKARWSFLAPAKFLGNFARIYNGFLEFDLTSFAGDFTSNVVPNPKTFVEISCSTCGGGSGITLAQRNITYLGDTRHFKFTLNELPINEWKKDPQNMFQTQWTSPTYTEFFQVLSAISKIAIYPDITTGQESVGVDNIRLVYGSPDVNILAYP